MSVSVVIPCYNAEKYLVETFMSVLNQTRLPDEVIFIDDGSTDHTKDIIDVYKECIFHPEIKISVYENDENMGIGYTRQKGIDVADGDYIAFLSSDDVWHRGFLEQSMNRINLIDKHPHVGTYTDYYRCDPKLNPVRIFRCPEYSTQNVIDWALRKNMFINFSSVVFPKLLPVMFETKLRRGEDLIFLLDTIRANFYWSRIPEPLVYYRVMKRHFDLDKFLMLWGYNKDRLIKLGIDSKLIDTILKDSYNKVTESRIRKLFKRR